MGEPVLYGADGNQIDLNSALGRDAREKSLELVAQVFDDLLGDLRPEEYPQSAEELKELLSKLDEAKKSRYTFDVGEGKLQIPLDFMVGQVQVKGTLPIYKIAGVAGASAFAAILKNAFERSSSEVQYQPPAITTDIEKTIRKVYEVSAQLLECRSTDARNTIVRSWVEAALGRKIPKEFRALTAEDRNLIQTWRRTLSDFFNRDSFDSFIPWALTIDRNGKVQYEPNQRFDMTTLLWLPHFLSSRIDVFRQPLELYWDAKSEVYFGLPELNIRQDGIRLRSRYMDALKAALLRRRERRSFFHEGIASVRPANGFWDESQMRVAYKLNEFLAAHTRSIGMKTPYCVERSNSRPEDRSALIFIDGHNKHSWPLPAEYAHFKFTFENGCIRKKPWGRTFRDKELTLYCLVTFYETAKIAFVYFQGNTNLALEGAFWAMTRRDTVDKMLAGTDFLRIGMRDRVLQSVVKVELPLYEGKDIDRVSVEDSWLSLL